MWIRGGKVTIKNGYINATNTEYGCIFISEPAEVIFDNVEITSDNIAVYNDDGMLSILSGKYQGDDHAVSCIDGTVTITAGHFESTNFGCINAGEFEWGGVIYKGEIILAEGSSADVENWDSGAKVVTITAGGSSGVVKTECAASLPVAYYSTLGQKLPKEPESGLYIIMYDNGKTKKVLK